MSRLARLQEIRSLDPQRDHLRIVYLTTCFEFPWDTTRALEFALYRTYCVPSISGLLDQTGEFLRCPQKRYDDTDIIVSELMEWGYDSDRGRRALRRMNQIHGRFAISNDDFRYVLSTFVFEPIRWIDRYGWRPIDGTEKLAMFYFWREVGRRMGIQDLPDSYEEFERYNVEYEREHFHFAPSNQRIGGATRDLFLSWFPEPFRPAGKWVIYGLMDEPLLDAFGFPRPPEWLRELVRVGLRARAALLSWLPPRRTARLRTETKHRTYPDGYTIEHLGPRAP